MGKASSPLAPHRLLGMEHLCKAHHKAPKQAKKAKREPIKVVYISNPMRVVASAAEFRARVIALTGRDSDITDTSKYAAFDDSPAAPEPVSAAAYRPGPAGPDPCADRSANLYPFDMFDEAFTPRTLENLPGFMPPSLFYEPHPDGTFRSLD